MELTMKRKSGQSPPAQSPEAKSKTLNDARSEQGLKPFTFRNRKPEVDQKVDAFLAQPTIAPRVEITDKSYFVRCWALGIVNREEQSEDYVASIKQALDQPENQALKSELEKGVERISDPNARERALGRDMRAAVRQGRIKLST